MGGREREKEGEKEGEKGRDEMRRMKKIECGGYGLGNGSGCDGT